LSDAEFPVLRCHAEFFTGFLNILCAPEKGRAAVEVQVGFKEYGIGP
jgi:hypothetical protein